VKAITPSVLLKLHAVGTDCGTDAADGWNEVKETQMGRGAFPLYRSGQNGKKLIEALRLMEIVQCDLSDAVSTGDSGGGQFDNAASDGAALERLNIAAELVRDCIEPEKPPTAG